LYRHGYYALCSMNWEDYQGLYDHHAASLTWQAASFLSREQQRRRASDSALPRDEYRLAVLHHALTDPSSGAALPGRPIFVSSSADARGCRQRRADNIATIRAGLEAIAARAARGHVRCRPETIARAVTRLLGQWAAARYFHWHVQILTEAERAALPAPAPGQRRSSYRLLYSFDAAAAEAEVRYDGLSVLFTTAPLLRSADELSSDFKGQNAIELLHHQSKTPLAVRPVFLKSPQRVEALVSLLQVALQVYQVLERRYRQTVAAEAPVSERQMTAESLLRHFRVYGLVLRREAVGRVVQATRLTQRQILQQLSLPTPAQLLRQSLPAVPTG
jgi:hypothetical protein